MSARRFRRISYIALLAVLGVHLAPVTGEAQQHALPQGPSVVSGGVTVGAPSGGGLTVTQSTPRAIVNWNSFSVGQPNSVTFQQPGSSSAILNRVTGGTTSTIAGKVSANGQVFLVNPNGIAITPTGTINVGGGFVGSTLDIRDQDFLGGVLDFFGTGSSAGVVNQGSIQAGSGGFVGLLGGNISNAGTISVPLGRVGLGAGERAALDLTGDGFLQVAIPPGTVSARALIDSSGRIKAPGGRVELKAATVRRAIRDAVNVSGTIAAKSVSGVDGAIVLGGGEGGNVNVTGTLDAGGATKGGAVDVSGRSVRIDGDARISTRSEAAKGGAVTITASDKITLGKAKIDASGATGGGHVRIGGDLQGGGTLTRAHDVVIGADAEIRADAAADGNGGTIIVWSDSLTSFEGRISARGGALGGDGGFVEVSGKQVLDYRGLADLTSYKGRFGTLLLDPYDITIWSGASARVSGLTPSANDSLINVSTLRDQIELANVTLTTGASGSQNGNITLLAPLSWTADTVLTLSAAGSIFVHAPIVATGTSAGFAVNHGGQFKVSPGAFVSLPGASSTFSANGESYTMIRSVADLQAIQNGLAGKYAIAVAIDAADTATWNGGAGFKPIGKDYPFFTGSLQGLGNPIVNLTINRPGEDRVGLFSVTDGGAFISNVALAGVSITGQSKVGGLVGTSYGASTISSSYVTGSISANGWESSVGGIVGYAWNGGVIADSFSSADVTGTGVVGGLVGFNQGTITRSHATGTITATNYIAGGLVGSNYGTVQFSYATGVVHAASMMAGGLVGDNTDGRIDYSYSTGSVTGGDSVGGLVGYMNRAAVLGSYATGSVAGQSSVGGLVGASANSSHVTQSYWDIQTTGISWGYSYASGTFSATGLTTAQATSQASYTSFDFTNTWVSFDGARPMLRHEYSQGIWNTNQLQLMGLKLGGRYVLTQDIDARATGVASSVWGTSGFSPVGTSSQNFTGSFDGAGFEISGLTINRASQTDVGLFGRVRGSSSRISNVGLVGGSIRGGTNTGSLVGQLEVNATVSNSYASSTVAGTTATGGLIGIISAATVEGSHATGAVTGQASSGGLVGSVTGTIRDSYATGTVTGDGSMGGLAGGASSATISGSYATGNVTSTGNSVGGLLGGGTQTTVLSSYASGTVQGAESVGGLIGSLAYGSTLSKSYATGAVSGTTQVGGLVGYLRETNHSPLTSVTESYATGNVTATGSKVGGLVGYSNYYTTVAKSYATGNVSGLTNVGGLIGESWQYTKISYSYATGTVSGTTSVGGLVGVLQQASTTLNSYATGAVTGSSRVGGLVGSLSGSTVMQSYATGDASGPESIGGLVGYLYQGSVYSSYARGNATGTGGSSNLIGGLVGVSHGSYLESNYSTGTVLGTTNVGGFIGLNNGSSLSANYWDTQSSGRATGGSGVSYGVTGRTTAQMQNISNFATNFVGWDFSGIWVPPNQAGQGGDTTAHYPELYAMARAIAVKADDASVTYGDARPSFTYGRYGGYDAVTGVTAYVLAGPETITPSDIPGAFSLADPNASSKSSTGHDNAGSYAITANAVASPGISAASPAGTETYRLIVVPGTLTVDRKALTATATANNKVYDATAAGSVTFADDRLSGDVLTVDSTETVFADVNVGTGIATTTSGITLSGADAANYSVNATATSSADITVRHVTVTADAGQSKIYGTTDPVLAYAISSGSLVGSDAFSGVLSRAAGENVGSYAIGQGSLDLGGNYNLTFTPGTTFAVTQRPITVAANAGQSKIYGNADPAFAYAISSGSLVGSDAFSGVLSRAAGENVGSYAIGQGSLDLGGNYSLTFTPGTTFAVTQRPITVAANAGQSKVYGTTDPVLAYAISSGSLVGSDTFSGVLSRAAGENVGSYAIGQGSLDLGGNYSLTFTPGTTFAVTQRPITVTANAGQSKVYGNADPAFTYTIGGLGLAFSDTLSGALARAAGENVGSYAIGQGTIAASSNYSLTFTPGTTFAVTQRPITVAANAGQSKVYGTTDPVLAYAISSGSLVGSDTFSGVLSRAAGENVGSYAIGQGSLDLGGNYNLTFTPGTTFAVTQRPITVAANAGQSKVYGTTDPVLAYAISSGSLVGSDTFSGVLSRAAGENVGSYAIGQGSLDLGGNYSLTFTPGTTFAVTQRPITVTADSGQSKVYGNADPVFTYTIGGLGLAFSDTLSGALARAAGENVGSYAIGQGTIAASSNYSLTFTPGTTFAVTQRPITVAANAGQSKVYGTTDPVLAYAISSGSLVGSDTFSGVLSRAAGENVGSYAIGQGSLDLGGNYNLTFTPGTTFAVTQRPITVAANAGQSKIYGNADPAFAYAISSGSLVGSDTFSGVLSRAAGENVGSYAIGQGSLDLGGNYSLTFTPGTTFAVTQRPITVTANAGQSKVYGNADSAFTYTIGGLGLAFSDTLSGALARAAGENVGSYAIGQGTIAASSNYTLTFTPGTTFAVTQRPITVTADSGQSKIYGHADPAFAYTIGGLGLAFSDTLSGALARTAGENVGSYAIGQGTIAASSNYALTVTPGTTFAVTPRAIAVTADTGQAKVYGNADPVFAYAISSGTLVGSDAFSGTLDRATGENVGTYSIALGSLTLGPNYTLTVTPGTTFAVTQRPITVAANAGQSKIYGNADPAFAYAISSGSLVGSDAFSGVLSRSAGENVGSYAIEQGSLDLGGNYSLTFTPGTTFAVTQRPIAVAANAGQSKVYGNADPVFAYAIGGLGLAFSDALTGELARAAGENVGSYAIGQGTIAASSNYTLTFTPGTTFTVTPRPITVTADAGQSKVYGITDPAFAYTIGGMGMAFSDALSGALTRATGEDAGSYAIGQGTIAASSNYALTFTPGTTFAVTPRPITVTADTGQSKVYGNADPVFTYHISSGTLVGSEAFSGVLDRVSGENVGTYGIGAGSLALSANYTLSFVPGTSFAITPRPVTVAANAGQTKIYGNADPVLAYAISSGSLVGSDAFSGDLSRSAGENVGSYAIEQGSLDLGGNYNLTFTPGTTFAITPRSLTVTALNVTRVNDGVAFYGGNGVSYAGLAVWDTPSVLGGTLVYGGSAQGSHKTGSYDITVSGLSSGNYTIGYMPGMLVIDPKPPSGPSLSSMTPQTLVAGQTMERWSSDKTSPLFPVEFNNQVAADEDSEND